MPLVHFWSSSLFQKLKWVTTTTMATVTTMTKTFTIYRDNKLVAKASLCLEMLGTVQYQAYNLLFSVELLRI